MKDFKKYLLAIFILAVSLSAKTSDLSTIVEGSLRKPLNLVTGPATQVVDFELDGKTIVIVVADLSFNKTLGNPFAKNEKTEERTSEKEVEKAVKNTFVKLQNTKFRRKNEIYIIIFDKKLFGRTDNKTLRKFVYKGIFKKGKLLRVEKLK